MKIQALGASAAKPAAETKFRAWSTKCGIDIPPKRKPPDDEERKPPSDGESAEAVDSNGSSSYKEETIATPSGKKAL